MGPMRRTFSRRSETGADPVSCVRISFSSFWARKLKRPLFATLDRLDRPSTWGGDRSLVAFFLLGLRNAIDGRAPEGLLGLSWQKEVAGDDPRRKAGPGSLGPCCTRWLEKIAGDRSRPGVRGVPVHDLRRVAGAQLWVNRTSSAVDRGMHF
jgi:hypothetical protein